MLDDVKNRENSNGTAELLDRCMRDLNMEEAVVHACLKQAGEAELKKYGFDYFFLNFLAIFKGQMSLEHLRLLAAKATVAKLWGSWEYFSYLTKLADKAAFGATTKGTPVRLKGWDVDLIRELMDRGNGLIVCSHHLGAYRYLQTDLVFLGLKQVLLLDRAAYEQMTGGLNLAKAALRRSPGADSALEGMLDSINLVNVEERSAAAKILKALKRGEIVLAFADGNTGLDGPLGKKSRSEIDFFGFHISVKNGVARMSAAMTTPILPILAVADGKGAERVVFSEPIIPPAESSESAERDAFVQSTMQTLYRFLEHHARSAPETWQSSCFLHRWRVAAQQDCLLPADISAERSEVIRLLDLGACLKLDGNRAAIVDTYGGRVLVDVKTLRLYGNITWAEDLLRVLFDSGGLQREWMNSQGADFVRKDKYLDLLAHFKSTDLLQWASL